MKRREALFAMLAATCGALRARAAVSLPHSGPDVAPRAYSEEGVPVFLACENLLTVATSQSRPVTLTPFNAAVASDFRQRAEAWQRSHPDATADDVAKLIEALAERDFAAGGA